MSKLVNDLNRVSKSKHAHDTVIADQAPETVQPAVGAREHKGMFFIGFMIIILTVVSGLSLSVGLKTITWIKDGDADTAALIAAVEAQKKDIQAFKSQTASQSVDELTRIEALQKQVRGIASTLDERERSLNDLWAASKALKSLLEVSVKELKAADQLLVEKHVHLSEEIKKIADLRPAAVSMPESVNF